MAATFGGIQGQCLLTNLAWPEQSISKLIQRPAIVNSYDAPHANH